MYINVMCRRGSVEHEKTFFMKLIGHTVTRVITLLQHIKLSNASSSTKNVKCWK